MSEDFEAWPEHYLDRYETKIHRFSHKDTRDVMLSYLNHIRRAQERIVELEKALVESEARRKLHRVPKTDMAVYVRTDRPEEWPEFEIVCREYCCFQSLPRQARKSYLMKRKPNDKEER